MTKIDDPAQHAAINAWIRRVLQAAGIMTISMPKGVIGIAATPAKYVAVIEALSLGIHAAARGEELPELVRAPAKVRGVRR
jgi:hypothetical protein